MQDFVHQQYEAPRLQGLLFKPFVTNLEIAQNPKP